MSELWPFQKEAIKKIQHFKGRALLADEMGLGKTHEALGWLKLNPDKRPVIVVCPAFLKWVWESIASFHFDMQSEVLQGTKPTKIRLTKSHPLLIINYEILQYWLPYIQKLEPQVVALDEVHYIKNRRAKRTKAVKELCKGIPYLLGIGGTPSVNRPVELWPILNLIAPKEFPSFLSYAFRYCKPVRLPWGWLYKGADNLSELHNKLISLMMIRRLKKDVLKELPDKIRQIIPLQVEDGGEYSQAETNFIRWLTKKSISKAKRAKKAKQLAKMGYLKRLAAELKMKSVLNWIDGFLETNDGKLVLYCVHRKIVQMLHEKYRKISVVVDGSVTNRKRKIAVRSFQNNKSTRIFIGNIKAAGLGITLTAASVLAFVEMSWTPGDHTQAEDRIHRIGQKDPSTIYYFVARNTIEENLCRLIQKKQIILSETLDGKARIKELSIFDELEKELRKESNMAKPMSKNTSEEEAKKIYKLWVCRYGQKNANRLSRKVRRPFREKQNENH